MASQVVDIDRGMKQVIASLEFMDANVIDAGLVRNPDGAGNATADTIALDDDDRKNADSLTVGQLGAIHEFGLGDVPERPFVGPTIDMDTLLIEREVIDQVDATLGGRKAEVAMENIGELTAGRMQFTLDTSRGIKALTLARVAKKRMHGKTRTPLINQGLMREALRYKVHRG